MKAITQIFYSQYHTWEIFGSYMFQAFWKKHSNTQNHGQGTHSAKIDIANWPTIPQITLHFLAQFVCPSPKVRNFRKKALAVHPWFWTLHFSGRLDYKSTIVKLLWTSQKGSKMQGAYLGGDEMLLSTQLQMMRTCEANKKRL